MGEPWQGPSAPSIPRPTGVTRQAVKKVEQTGRKVGRPRLRPPHSLWSPKDGASNAVVHVELDRVRHHLEPLHLFHFQLEIGIDGVVGEDIALLQEGAVLVERLAGLAWGGA